MKLIEFGLGGQIGEKYWMEGEIKVGRNQMDEGEICWGKIQIEGRQTGKHL